MIDWKYLRKLAVYLVYGIISHGNYVYILFYHKLSSNVWAILSLTFQILL